MQRFDKERNWKREGKEKGEEDKALYRKEQG
jgi:hypothetical protein